jgi:hypothetical protein
MSNFKHEELGALQDAVDGVVSQVLQTKFGAPRAEGKCQASIARRRDGYRRATCMQCGFVVEGFLDQEFVDAWNEHIIYR